MAARAGTDQTGRPGGRHHGWRSDAPRAPERPSVPGSRRAGAVAEGSETAGTGSMTVVMAAMVTAAPARPVRFACGPRGRLLMATSSSPRIGRTEPSRTQRVRRRVRHCAVHALTNADCLASPWSDGPIAALLRGVRRLHRHEPGRAGHPGWHLRRGRGARQRFRDGGGNGAVLRVESSLGLVRSLAAIRPASGHAVLHALLRGPRDFDANGACCIGPHRRLRSRLAHPGGRGGQCGGLRFPVGGAVLRAGPGAVPPTASTGRRGDRHRADHGTRAERARFRR